MQPTNATDALPVNALCICENITDNYCDDCGTRYRVTMKQRKYGFLGDTGCDSMNDWYRDIYFEVNRLDPMLLAKAIENIKIKGGEK